MGTEFFVHHGIVPAVKRVEFVSDRTSYTVLRGHEKSDDSKDSFYEELEQVLIIFLSTI